VSVGRATAGGRQCVEELLDGALHRS
jgi:hypothetical protein